MENISTFNYSKPKIDSKMGEVGEKIVAKSDDVQRLEEEIHEVIEHSRQLMHDRQRLEQDLGNLRDPQQIFKKKLVEKNYPDIKKAMEWLEANRSLLKGECYGPAGAYVSISSYFYDIIIFDTRLSYFQMSLNHQYNTLHYINVCR
jgi:regulator of replication initiation timing